MTAYQRNVEMMTSMALCLCQRAISIVINDQRNNRGGSGGSVAGGVTSMA